MNFILYILWHIIGKTCSHRNKGIFAARIKMIVCKIAKYQFSINRQTVTDLLRCLSVDSFRCPRTALIFVTGVSRDTAPPPLLSLIIRLSYYTNIAM